MDHGPYRLREWYYIGGLALLGLALGFWGFTICTTTACHVVNVFDAFIRTLDLIRPTSRYALSNGDPWQLVVAQLFVPLAFLLGTFRIFLRDVRRDLRVAFARMKRKHTIVCGLGDTGRQIVENFVDHTMPVVAIALDADSPNAAACEARGVAVLAGDAMQKATLYFAGLKNADALIVTSGSDATNIEIGLRAREARAATRGILRILPQARDDFLYHGLLTHRAASLGSDNADFQLFNVEALAARTLMRRSGFARATIGAATEPARVLFAGFTTVSSETIIHAVRCNFALPDASLHAVVAGANAGSPVAEFLARFPVLGEAAQIEAADCDFRRDDSTTWKSATAIFDRFAPHAIIVDLDDDDASLRTALKLREKLDHRGLFRVPIYLRLKRQRELGAFLHTLESFTAGDDRIAPFGDLAALTRPTVILDETIDELAKAAHAVYLESKPVGPAAMPWQKLPERFKQSNRIAADHIPVNLRHAGLRLVEGAGPTIALTDAEIDAIARAEHWRWCIDQRFFGLSPGKTRDEFRRTNPFLAPWDQLPADLQARNRFGAQNFARIAKAANRSIKRERILHAGRDAGAALAKLGQMAPHEFPIVVLDGADPSSWSAFAAHERRAGAEFWLACPPAADQAAVAHQFAKVFGDTPVGRWIDAGSGAP